LILKYIVDKEVSGKTVKHILKAKMKLSERLIKKLKYQSKILCNRQPVLINVAVSQDDIIEVDLDVEEAGESVIPQDIPIDIIYEDESLIVINKKPGLVVHPTSIQPDDTLANAVSFYLQNKGIMKKVRPVIRLDRDTSGIIIFAKDSFSQNFLIKQMNDRSFLKEYIGVVHGIVNPGTGVIDMPISRMPGSIIKRQVSKDGSPSLTHYNAIEYLNNATVLKFRLETGRTHQIRVHCQAIGYSLIGDTLYPQLPDPKINNLSISSDCKDTCISGNNTGISGNNHYLPTPEIINRQALHSCRVVFVHPYSRTTLELTAPIPDDITRALEILRK
jgi:23S rRNA pseudouridine1911/1915/1917 synthase